MSKGNGGSHMPIMPAIPEGSVAGSMFRPETPEQLEKRLKEVVTLSRGALAEMIHDGVMEITGTMGEQFDIQEKTIDKLETTNVQLRRDITALKHKLETQTKLLSKAKVFEA